jgi:hypothetical protein
VIVEEA